MTPDNDPMLRLMRALAGAGLAMVLSVPLAALVGRWLGDWLGDTYEARVACYGGLLLYLLVGAVLLLRQVAAQERQPFSAGRVLRWLASLWLWPALLLATRARPPAR